MLFVSERGELLDLIQTRELPLDVLQDVDQSAMDRSEPLPGPPRNIVYPLGLGQSLEALHEI